MNIIHNSVTNNESEVVDILSFEGKDRYLSNFHPSTVMLDGVMYPSIENAYQAAKTSPDLRKPFVNCTAGEAKKLGRRAALRSDWEHIKVDVMRDLIQQKFAEGTPFAEKLMATGDGKIVEGNWWGDTYWGVCRGVGQNNLGELLMEQRYRLLTNAT